MDLFASRDDSRIKEKLIVGNTEACVGLGFDVFAALS